MATAIASTGFTQEAFDAFLAARDEPAWLTELRRKAWRRFVELPMPSSRDEEWMRTDIRLFKLDRYRLPDPAPHESPEFPHALLAAGVELGGRTVSVDSRSVLAELAPELCQAGRAVRQFERAGGRAWRAVAAVFRAAGRRSVQGQVLGAQRRVLVRRAALVRAQGRADRRAAAHALGTHRRRRRPQQNSRDPRTRRRSDAALRNGQHQCRWRRAPLRRRSN